MMQQPQTKTVPHVMRAFSAATLAPVFLLAMAALYGGLWAAFALIYMTILSYGLDMLVQLTQPPSDAQAEFPAANGLSTILALSHLMLLPALVFVLSHDQLGVFEKVLIFFASGLFFGQVSNSNAHELVHRTNPFLRRLGIWVYISILFGHHASAHPKVHHRFVGTDMDPNSAPKGMSYYTFLPRAWIGSFKAGLLAETTLRAQAPKGGLHPYVLYIGGAISCMTLAVIIGGLSGLIIYIALAFYATCQLILSDYVQHYGLRRRMRAQGGFEPVGTAHSWNSPHWFSSFLMLNAPRHSDHHAHPMTPYVALQMTPDMPMWPRPLPAMAALALFPHPWRRVMDHRVDRIMTAKSRSTSEPS
jgi:alkane 1-monooxygenase